MLYSAWLISNALLLQAFAMHIRRIEIKQKMQEIFNEAAFVIGELQLTYLLMVLSDHQGLQILIGASDFR